MQLANAMSSAWQPVKLHMLDELFTPHECGLHALVHFGVALLLLGRAFALRRLRGQVVLGSKRQPPQSSLILLM